MKTAIRMALAFQVVLILVPMVQHLWGRAGVLASAAILGLTDVDSLTFSMTRLADGPHAIELDRGHARHRGRGLPRPGRRRRSRRSGVNIGEGSLRGREFRVGLTVARLIEKRACFTPRPLFIPPIGKFGTHNGKGIRTDLRIAQHLDRITGGSQHILQGSITHKCGTLLI